MIKPNSAHLTLNEAPQGEVELHRYQMNDAV